MWSDREIMGLLTTVVIVVLGCFALGYLVLP